MTLYQQIQGLVTLYPLSETKAFAIAHTLRGMGYSDDAILAYISTTGKLAEHGIRG